MEQLAWPLAPQHPGYDYFVLQPLTEQEEEECELWLYEWSAARFQPGGVPAIELRPALDAILTPAMPPLRALITDTLKYEAASLAGCSQLSSLTRLVFDDASGTVQPEQGSEVLQVRFGLHSTTSGAGLPRPGACDECWHRCQQTVDVVHKGWVVGCLLFPTWHPVAPQHC